jgi:hypothetical protein
MQSETIIEPGSGAAVLADLYTRELGNFCKDCLPVTLSNDEYMSRISALIVALNRMLAEYVVTSAHVHGADLGEMLDLTATQLIRNVNKAVAAIHGDGSTVQ